MTRLRKMWIKGFLKLNVEESDAQVEGVVGQTHRTQRLEKYTCIFLKA
jgi:hypothetical protein